MCNVFLESNFSKTVNTSSPKRSASGLELFVVNNGADAPPKAEHVRLLKTVVETVSKFWITIVDEDLFSNTSDKDILYPFPGCFFFKR